MKPCVYRAAAATGLCLAWVLHPVPPLGQVLPCSGVTQVLSEKAAKRHIGVGRLGAQGTGRGSSASGTPCLVTERTWSPKAALIFWSCRA